MLDDWLSLDYQPSRRELLTTGGTLASGALIAPWLKLLDTRSVKVAERVVAGSNSDFMIARHLRIEGSNREIGRALAKIAKSRHNAKIGLVDPKSGKARKLFFQVRYPALYERARGSAEEFGFDWSKDGNDLFSIGYDGIDSPACSTVFYPGTFAQSGHPTMSRNYDFSTATLAEMVGMPASRSSRPFTGDPYILELHPDKGYASLAVVSYDLLAGAIDGINSEGLCVALLADGANGKKPAPGAQAGLGEIEVPRYLLDTCANVKEAKTALQSVPQYFTFIACHYIIGDRHGNSFVWEIGENGKHAIVEGAHKPQVVTNHLVSQFKDPDKHVESFPGGSFNRFCKLRDGIAMHNGPLTVDEMKRLNLQVQAGPEEPVQGPTGRTLWHSVYDLSERTLEIDFYLGESSTGERGQKRSGYHRFKL